MALLAGCRDSSRDGDAVIEGGSRSAQIPASALVVNNTLDQVDAVPGDGTCASAEGACTLRAAIMEANASGFDAEGRRHTIFVPAGRYTLTIRNSAEVPAQQLVAVDSAGSLLLKVPI
ncbi:MAG: hypothetical protein ACREB3_04075, partial [Burkholderiales bacterium]